MSVSARRVATAAVFATVVVATAPTAWARPYPIPLEITTLAELDDHYAAGQLDDATYVLLREWLDTGIDLNHASRDQIYALPGLTYRDVDKILAYRQHVGSISAPVELVRAGVLSRDQLAEVAAFVRTAVPARQHVHGSVESQILWVIGDQGAPPMRLHARINALGFFTAGIAATLTRLRPGAPVWDPNRGALSLSPAKPRPRVPKFFVRWETPTYAITAGTYRIGFGQRLTFDTTGQYRPNGLLPDDTLIRATYLRTSCPYALGERTTLDCDPDRYRAGDYRWRPTLLGLAGGAKHVALAVGWLEFYAWISANPVDVSAADLRQRHTDQTSCADDSAEPSSCANLSVYETRQPILTPSRRVIDAVLPGSLLMVLGGVHMAWFHSARAHLALTGYGARPQWRIRGSQLDFRDSAMFPPGGSFGSLGAEAAWGRGAVDLFAEVASSFTAGHPRQPGAAAISGINLGWPNHSIELSARIYAPSFENPYARAIAASDQSYGLRARDEWGARLRAHTQLGRRLAVRSLIDLWSPVTQRRVQLAALLRGDLDVTPWLSAALWFTLRDRSIGKQRRGECFDRPASAGAIAEMDAQASQMQNPLDPDFALDSPPVPSRACAGERFTLTTGLHWSIHRRVWLAMQYRHGFTDDPKSPSGIRHSAAAGITLGSQPTDGLSLTSRWRYADGDLQHHAHQPAYLRGYTAIDYRIRPWLQPGMAYELRMLTDGRPSSLTRRPNPEHWLWFDLRARF